MEVQVEIDGKRELYEVRNIQAVSGKGIGT